MLRRRGQSPTLLDPRERKAPDDELVAFASARTLVLSLEINLEVNLYTHLSFRCKNVRAKMDSLVRRWIRRAHTTDGNYD